MMILSWGAERHSAVGLPLESIPNMQIMDMRKPDELHSIYQ